MSPLLVLADYYVGKQIVGGNEYIPLKYYGGVIIDVTLHSVEPIFLFTVKCNDGTIEIVDILQDWNIEVQSIR